MRARLRCPWLWACLLSLAVGAPPPLNAPPKLAFLFLVVDSVPLAETWGRFFARAPPSAYSIYIHAMPGVAFTASRVASPLFVGRQLSDPVLTKYGGVNVVRAEVLLFREALKDPLNAWFILLSERCAPIRTWAYVYDYFQHATALGTSFVRSFPTDARFDLRYDAKLVPRAAWRKGSQWVTLRRADAQLVVDSKPLLDEILRDEKAFALDEHAIHTVLAVNNRSIAGHTLTYFDWKSGPHPTLFQARARGLNLTGLKWDDVLVTLSQADLLVLLRKVYALRSMQHPALTRHLFGRKWSSEGARAMYSTVEALDAGDTFSKEGETVAG